MKPFIYCLPRTAFEVGETRARYIIMHLSTFYARILGWRQDMHALRTEMHA